MFIRFKIGIDRKSSSFSKFGEIEFKSEFIIKKYDFINSPNTESFIDWFQPKLDGPDKFVCNFHLKRLRRNWSCTNLYSAYESYWWPFLAT